MNKSRTLEWATFVFGTMLSLGGLYVAWRTHADPAKCTPGHYQSCTCGDGEVGQQTCSEDGKLFSTCVCSGAMEDEYAPEPTVSEANEQINHAIEQGRKTLHDFAKGEAREDFSGPPPSEQARADSISVDVQSAQKENSEFTWKSLNPAAKRFWRGIGEGDCKGDAKESGLREAAECVQSLLSVQVLQESFEESFGELIFVSGPHSTKGIRSTDGVTDKIGESVVDTEALDLSNVSDFGHYNRNFVEWVGQHFVPSRRETAFQRSTQSVFDHYMKPIARACFATHLKIQKNVEQFRAEVDWYRDKLKAGEYLGYHRWGDFMDPYFYGNLHGEDNDPCPGVEGWDEEEPSKTKTEEMVLSCSAVHTCVKFWIRRDIDGTRPIFASHLERLMKVYDPDYKPKIEILWHPPAED